MSEFLKNKVNIFLLLLVVILIICIIALSTIYNIEFRNLNKQAKDASKNLALCSKNLTLYSEEVTRLQRQLNMTSQDVETFEDIYIEKTEEVSLKEKEIAKLQQDLKKAKEEVITYKKNYLDTKALLDATTLNLQTCKNEKADLKEELDECESDLEVCLLNCT